MARRAYGPSGYDADSFRLRAHFEGGGGGARRLALIPAGFSACWLCDRRHHERRCPLNPSRPRFNHSHFALQATGRCATTPRLPHDPIRPSLLRWWRAAAAVCPAMTVSAPLTQRRRPSITRALVVRVVGALAMANVQLSSRRWRRGGGAPFHRPRCEAADWRKALAPTRAPLGEHTTWAVGESYTARWSGRAVSR